MRASNSFQRIVVSSKRKIGLYDICAYPSNRGGSPVQGFIQISTSSLQPKNMEVRSMSALRGSCLLKKGKLF